MSRKVPGILLALQEWEVVGSSRQDWLNLWNRRSRTLSWKRSGILTQSPEDAEPHMSLLLNLEWAPWLLTRWLFLSFRRFQEGPHSATWSTSCSLPQVADSSLSQPTRSRMGCSGEGSKPESRSRGQRAWEGVPARRDVGMVHSVRPASPPMSEHFSVSAGVCM